MKRFTAAQARQHLSALLDAAERGERVVIERGVVRFGVTAERRVGRRRHQPRVSFVDPAVEAGEWTWGWARGGLGFVPRRRPR